MNSSAPRFVSTKILLLILATGTLVVGSAFAADASPGDPAQRLRAQRLPVELTSAGDHSQLALGETTFHSTRAAIEDLRVVDLASVEGASVAGANVEGLKSSPTRLILWNERTADGVSPHYAISLDGRSVRRVRSTSYEVRLRGRQFDPLVAVPDYSASPLPAAGNVYLVQFVTQPLEEMRATLRDLGADVQNFLTDHCHLVRMDAATRDTVAELPFVRWVGLYHPELRTEAFLLERLRDSSMAEPMRLYVQVFERGLAEKRVVAQRIRALGGEIVAMIPDGFRLEANLNDKQLRQVLQWDEVLFVDRWTPPETDVNLARELSGANYVEMVAGWSGQGVRAEVMDGNVRRNHQDFQVNPIIIHGNRGGDSSHGTPVTGIVFGTGAANPQGRGFLPDGQAIFADYGNLGNRYTHTAEILQAPYFGVFQTNSWGGGRTRDYTSTSMEMDDIIFLNDFVILNSQSNAGNQDSRPQAWAKNIVSVGGIRHQNTLTTTDDEWNGGASVGPAADGRIKPDLAHFYDSTLAPSSSSTTAYTQFGGTSGATPITAGNFGIFFQMWHNGIFGNTPGATVFDSRPHATLAKAMMVNSATQWPFAGTSSDLRRVHQGWGRADVRDLYDLRDKLFYVDESDVLTNLGSISYQLVVNAGEPQLKATLVYMDVAGTTSAGQHRINDLSLQVTSPGGTTYWGNNGLLGSMTSSPGGNSNTLDTVENVIIDTPQAGVWTVTVLADEVNADTHTETPQTDADFALVVSGVEEAQVGCSLIAPAAPVFNPVDLQVDTFTVFGSTVDTTIEFSTNAGASWQPCTPAAGSVLPNPGTAVTPGPSSFLWDAAADAVGVGGVSLGVQVRMTVDDGVAPLPGECMATFDVIPEPPTCTIAGPMPSGRGDVPIQLDTATVSAATVDTLIEYSVNGGTTWTICAPAGGSTNPATGVATGMTTFTWDSLRDGVALAAVESVIVRALVTDGVSPIDGECVSAPFDVDNVPFPPNCNVTAPPVGFRDVDINFDVMSVHVGTVDLVFEWTSDGGTTWNTCTVAAGSPVPNPASGVPNGMGTFRWNTLADMLGTSVLQSVAVRVLATDSVSPLTGSCRSAPFDIDNLPPMCMLTAPSSPANNDIDIGLTTSSSHSSLVFMTFEHSTDGGTTWRLCTTAAGSPVTNPGGSTPTGSTSFRWDSRADGIGLTAAVPGVMVRASVIDAIAPTSGACATAPFDVDNTVRCGGICGDCDLNGSTPDVLDSLLAAQIAAGIQNAVGDQEFCCDIDSSSSVNVLDSLGIAQEAVQLSVTLTCP